MKNCNADQVRIIEREYATLLKKLSEFEAIKKEIGFLVKKSSADPQARVALKEIRKVIPYSINAMEIKLKKDLEKVNSVLKTLDLDIKWPC